jgi:hypothetical protein
MSDFQPYFAPGGDNEQVMCAARFANRADRAILDAKPSGGGRVNTGSGAVGQRQSVNKFAILNINPPLAWFTPHRKGTQL